MVKITYQSFNAQNPSDMIVHPQLLKEYNNRWFDLCLNKKQYYTLTLDRMIKISSESNVEYIDRYIDCDAYYKDVIGAKDNHISAHKELNFGLIKNAPYVITNPL